MQKNNDIKQIRKAQRIPFSRQLSRNFSFSYKNFLWGLFAIIGVAIISVTIRFFFFSSFFYIQKVRFNDNSIKTYSNLKLYSDVQSFYQGKNIVRLFLGGYNKQFDALKKTYPFLSSLDNEYHRPREITSSPNFMKPFLIFRLQKKDLFLSEKEAFFPVSSQDILIKNSVVIDVPDYLYDIDVLNGMYARISQQKLMQSVSMIKDTLGSGEILGREYIPGGGILKVVISTNQNLLFHIDRDINQQLVKLVDIREHFKDITQYTHIDLGSMEYVVVR